MCIMVNTTCVVQVSNNSYAMAKLLIQQLHASAGSKLYVDQQMFYTHYSTYFWESLTSSGMWCLFFLDTNMATIHQPASLP